MRVQDSTALHIGGTATVMVPVGMLCEADSPRLDGEQDEHARTLAESENPLPPIIVHRATMRVIDGMHRLKAARLRFADKIAVRFFDGDERDAFVLAVEANTTHGLPLSLADRTAAAARIIRSHPEWSDRAIAAVTGLSARTVAAARERASDDVPQLLARIGRDGRIRPLDSTLGRVRAGELLAAEPGLSLREVARRAGISTGTARDVRQRLARGEAPAPAKPDSDHDQGERQAKSSGDGPVTRRVQPPVDLSVILERLKGDPSLRFTAGGRILLRLLDVHSIDVDKWEQLIDNVPAHCVSLVTDIAEECAQSWQRFAAELKQRQMAV